MIYVRKDAYCHECFILFAKSKYRRAIDAFRLELEAGQKDVQMLLALSGGECSIVLVDLAYTSIVRTRGKYALPIVLHIDDSEYTGQSHTHVTLQIDLLKQKYPELTFIIRPMHDIDEYVTESYIREERDKLSLRNCIAALPSRTSQEDMLTLYKERLMIETAREYGCRAILFGNSATSLAAKTLALTAKGRGYALPWETTDHSLAHSGIWSVRPLKGLLTKEIQTYSELLELNVQPRRQRSALPQATSIDELTKQYFDNLEAQFPSLVATVVRTTNKLVEPVPPNEALGKCTICGMTYKSDAKRWLSDITVSEATPEHFEVDDGPSHSADRHISSLCYGCTVALRGAKVEHSWPLLAKAVGSRENTAHKVVAQYELQDE